MKSFLRFLLPFLMLACGLRSQTTGFQNVNIRGTLDMVSGANATISPGASLYYLANSEATNQLLFIQNGTSGVVYPLILGSGLSITGTGPYTLVAGSSSSANPTAVVGTTAVNGSASTYMRSDAAPAINLTMAPTWTGIHTFNPTSAITSGSDYGVKILPILNQRNATNYSALYIDEYITQAGTGNQYFIEAATGGGSPVDTFAVTAAGAVSIGSWAATPVGSAFGGTGLTTFAEGSILVASGANTWSALAAGLVNYVYASSGAGSVGSFQSISPILDSLGTVAQGAVLYRGASGWNILLAGTTGQVFETQGSAANPIWASVSAGPGTTVQHDVASYSNTTGSFEDTGVMNLGGSVATIVGTTSVNTGVLAVSTTNANGYIGSFLTPNMASGENLFMWGQTIGTNNALLMGINIVGSGSTSNFFGIGFYGNAYDMFKFAATGNFTAVGSLNGLAGTFSNAVSAGGTAYSYGAASATGAAAILVPATTYTLTGGSPANFQATYFGAPTFTDSTSGTMAIGATVTINGAPIQAGSLTITTPVALLVNSGLAFFKGTFLASSPNSGFAGNYSGFTTTGQSNGVFINAGTNSSDMAMEILNSGQSLAFFEVRGDGNVLIPSGSVTVGTTSTSGTNVNIITIAGESGHAGYGPYAQFTDGAGTAGVFGSSNGVVGDTNRNFAILTAQSVVFYSGGSLAFTLNSSQNALFAKLISSYNGIATAGWGANVTQGFGYFAAQGAAKASVATYTVGSADGDFDISAYVNIVSVTACSFTVTCIYTDEGNTSRTLTLGFTQLSGATLLSTITNVTGTGPYESPVYHIHAKSGTAITIASAPGGTYTTVSYDISGKIVQG